MTDKPLFTKDKIFYAIIAPIVVAIAVFLFQYFWQSRKPVVSYSGESGILSVTNNSKELVRVRVTYVFQDADGNTEFCTSPVMLTEDDQPGYPTKSLLSGETKSFPYDENCPSVSGANPIGFGIRVWNEKLETIYHIEPDV